MYPPDPYFPPNWVPSTPENQLNADFLSNIYTRSANYSIKIESNISLTGATLQLVIVDPNGLRRIISNSNLTISSDGTYVTLLTDENTFTVAGENELQLSVVTGTSPNFEYQDAAILTVNVQQSL